MKFFLDTANVKEIADAAAMGLLDGVTTNPSLVAKEGRKDYNELLTEICKIVDGDISAEVIATDFEGMMREGRIYAKIHENIVVKVPLTPDGLKAVMKALKIEGIRTNVTLCFSPSQALLAAKAFAHHAFEIGRDDFGADIAIDNLADFGQQFIIVFAAFLGDQARVGSDTVQQTHCCSISDFFYVSGI